MSLPKVSCVCPTFCRAYLLEEAIESFLRQDYKGEKELIVCNDFVQQELIYNHPLVKVINLPQRAFNLGEKRNIAYSYATGDLLLTWGDDDVHLPGRVSRMVNAVQTLGKEFVFEGPYYILYNNKLSWDKGKTSGAHIVSKRLFDDVGGIPLKNSGEDQAFNELVKRKIGTLGICQDNPQFLYRFSSGRAHISQFGQDKEGKKSGWESMLDMANAYIKAGQEPKGKYVLNPKWSRDWVKEVENIKAPN